LRDERNAISYGASLLRDGGVVAFPTETVYGLGADAANEQAVRRLFSIKGRPADHPLIVHLADAGMIDRWAREIPAAAFRLAERFWPGPLTIILRRSATVSGLVTGGLHTVGIRVPAHPVAQILLREFGGGVAAPSANRFGRISPTCADHVRDELGSAPDLILDGGDCQVGLESTIISLVDDRPILLRPGGISLQKLCEALGREVAHPGQPVPALRAPGCHASHYAPLTPAFIITASHLPAILQESGAAGQRAAILCHGETPADLCPASQCLLLPNDPIGYGQALYASLRRLDAGGYDKILIEAVPETEEWRAVRDRLHRAAHPGTTEINYNHQEYPDERDSIRQRSFCPGSA
jgi:L-threonylcarbamoyladenylate synthase